MKHSLISLIVILILSNGISAQSTCKEVVGYYPNWQWYDRSQLVNPQTIDYSKYSIINYAFFAPQPDGSINSTDAWADENLLLGQPDWVNGGYIANTSIVDLAHNNGVLVLPSIGGWTLSSNFPAIAADPVRRTTFAQACVTLIQTYNFDGIDLDWEYPGYTPHGGTPADYNNFTLLLQEVRTAIDNYGVSVGKPMLLTAAVGANEARMADVNWTAVTPLLDIINLMSYDFFGAWDAASNHNSPLYAPAQGDPTFNLDNAVNKLVNFYNVPSTKITAGIAFYGRSAKTNGTPALFGSNNGSVDATTFWEDDGSPLYYNIMKNMNLFTDNWDGTAQVPYLTGNGALNTFVSYDNEQSIGLKAQYVVDNNLRGAIIWEITGDYMETSVGSGVIAGTPLADTLNNVFCNYTGGGSGSAPVVNIQANNTTICVGDNITLTANGADTYSWDTGATTQSISVSPTTTTTYTVTGTNAYGTDVETITITVNSIPTAPVVTVVDGCGSSTLSTAGSNLEWSTTETAASITVTSSGTYTVTQTVNGCTSADGSGTANPIVIPNAPTITVVNNCGNSTLTTSGTNLEWSTTETTSSITVTTAGTYTVTQTANGCTSSDGTATATPLALPSITTGMIDNPSSCGSSDGSIQIAGSGTGTVSWSGSASGSATNASLPYTVTGLSAGGYTISFDDGCPSNDVNASLSDPGAPSSPIISTNGATTFCDGGSVTLTSSQSTGNNWSTTETSASITVTTSGSYTVTYTDGNGCSSTSDATVVTVNPLPTVTFTTVDSVCVYTTPIILTGLPTGGTFSGSGVSNNQFDPSAAGLGSHTVNYSYTDGNGCTNSSSMSITVDGCASIEEQITPEAKVYPNPTSNELTIEIPGEYHFTVTDAFGRLVLTDQMTDKMTINTSFFEAGVYFVQINNSRLTQQTKFTKR